MSLHSGFSLNGYYDETGHWQRTKFCFVACTHCDCGPPGGLYYSAAHDQLRNQTAHLGVTPRAASVGAGCDATPAPSGADRAHRKEKR